MHEYQRTFIDLAVQHEVLCFGEFTLKSGRVSPYFFNAGRFCSARSLASLGSCYAAAALQSRIDFDVLFGPAYKGIPLVSATAVALAREFDRDVAFSFNRKEPKRHGEGGQIIGAPLKGKVLVIDDVITAGTAIREVAGLIEANNATLAGVLIGLDRRERGAGPKSACVELQESLSVPVVAIVTIDDVIEYVASTQALSDHLDQMTAYRRQWSPD